MSCEIRESMSRDVDVLPTESSVLPIYLEFFIVFNYIEYSKMLGFIFLIEKLKFCQLC